MQTASTKPASAIPERTVRPSLPYLDRGRILRPFGPRRARSAFLRGRRSGPYGRGRDEAHPAPAQLISSPETCHRPVSNDTTLTVEVGKALWADSVSYGSGSLRLDLRLGVRPFPSAHRGLAAP